MSRLRRWLSRLVAPLMGRRRERDPRAEIEAHLELLTEDFVRQGLSRDAAEAAARRSFGGVARTVASWQDERRIWILEDALADARVACRWFWRQPGYTVPAVLTLAAGMAATLLVFAVVSATLLRPLPFPRAERLVWLWPDGHHTVTHRQFEDLRAAVDRTSHLTAMARREFALSGGTRPVEVAGVAVSTNHFDVFGVAPSAGRGFTPADARPGSTPVALISDGLWRDAFGADPAIVGRDVRLDVAAAIPMVPGAFTGDGRQVIGVLPPGYAPFGFTPEVVVPLVVDPADPNFDALSELTVAGRPIRDEAPVVTGQAIDAAIATLPSFDRPEPVPSSAPIPLADALVGDRRQPLVMLLGAVLLVLLLACANVAHLSLARLASRSQELGLRTALGAGRGRLARQLLAESLVISGAASIVGLAGAWLALPVVEQFLPASLETGPLQLDASLMAFFIGLTAVTTIVAGAGPALHQARRPRPVPGVARITGSGAPRPWVHQVLAMTEIAMAVVLVALAGLFLRSLDRLVRVDPGFEPERVVTVRFSPSAPRYGDVDLRRTTVTAVLERVRRLPGVAAAAAIHFLPIAEGGPSVFVGPDPTRPGDRQAVSYRVVTPGYFATMGIPVSRGRDVRGDDGPSSTAVALVNGRLADQLWPDQDAIGQRLYRANGTSWTVVGVVGDVRQQALGLAPEPEFYVAMAQSTWASSMTIVARSDSALDRLGRQIEAAVHEVDAGIPVTRVAPMTAVLGTSTAEPRFYGRLFLGFGLLAVTLGTVGVYGVAAFLVGRRRREIAIRLALGARPGQVLRHEASRGGVAVLLGLGIGLGAALMAARGLEGFLFDVAPWDPAILAGTTALLGAIATIAMLVPVRRATAIDPASIIRE